VAVEETLLGSELATTIVRPGAVHGPGAVWAREWYFVKRALDERPVVFLSWNGESRFHTSAAANVAEVIALAAEPGGEPCPPRADPDPPRVLEIARAVARALDRSWEKVLIPGPPVEGVGETPWSTPFPFVLDLSLAERELGYRPVAGYADSVAASCAWLIEATRGRDWREVLPQTARLIGDLFDYSSEDTMIDR